MKKVVLFGGSFDPIHTGHLEVARRALKQLNADEVWFVLAGVSPFKKESTSFDNRATMIKKMIHPYRKLKLCTIEKYLPYPSYTIDTVKTLIKMHPSYQYSWLIGSDQIEMLDKWKDFTVLDQLIQFVVYPRFGYEIKHAYPVIDGPTIDVSSTDIRLGKETDTKDVVKSFMLRNGLYVESLTQSKMSDSRFQHTLRVKDLALELAHHHGINTNQVYLAAMAHDWCKEWSETELKQEILKINPKFLNLHPALYHGFAAASVLAKQYSVQDRHVLRAIRGHVTGASTHPIGMILYIADKCERGRKYDSEPLIRLAKKDLRQGFKAVKQQSNEYIGSKNGTIKRN